MAQSPDPLLVRIGLRYFRHLSDGRGRIDAGDGVHFLNPEERAALKRIERRAVIRAAIAGGLSTIVAAGVEVGIAQPLIEHHATLHANLEFWAIVGGVTAVTSILEILYLYWDGLRAVHDLSHAAGLDLFPDQDDDKALAAAMARAALELPNPSTALFGVNPWREASRFRLVIASLVYKAKVSVTNFAIKALVRRMLGRAIVRSWLPFVAVPITAAWNAFVCWIILREARVRAMGPSAANEMIGIIFQDAPELSQNARVAIVRAVASSIVRSEDMHPNLLALMKEVVDRVGVASSRLPHLPITTADEGGPVDDSRAFLARMKTLRQDEQRVVLRVLAVASIIDGRLTRNEKRLLTEAWEVCGVPSRLAAVQSLRDAFVGGDPIDAARIEAL